MHDRENILRASYVWTDDLYRVRISKYFILTTLLIVLQVDVRIAHWL